MGANFSPMEGTEVVPKPWSPLKIKKTAKLWEKRRPALAPMEITIAPDNAARRPTLSESGI